MPSIQQNRQTWAETYDWKHHGEEWSQAWGGSEAQWFGALLPRIYPFIPTGTILEIAPGFGRWTNYLRRYCDRLIVVDLGENCIRACAQRFASDTHITYHVNDGLSLAMVPDGSVDFVFSFDSLVHAEAEVLRAYLTQLAAKLTPDGVGFLHHSNLGAYRRAFDAIEHLPERVRRILAFDVNPGRARTVTARLIESLCNAVGLQCIGQEVIPWNTRRLIDCLSLVTRRGSRWAHSRVLLRNPGFMREAAVIKRRAERFGGPA